MSSYRPHPLRQTQTADYSVNRQSSTTSTSSSGYSASSLGPSDISRPISSLSSATSVYSQYGHKRGQSEASRLPSSLSGGSHTLPTTPTSDNIYKNARQSLRPTSQASTGATPTASSSSLTSTAWRNSPRTPTPGLHERGKSVDIGRLSIGDYGTSTTHRERGASLDNGKPSATERPRISPTGTIHDRISTFDAGKASVSERPRISPTGTVHERGSSFDVGKSSVPERPRISPTGALHERGHSIDIGKLSISDSSRTLSGMSPTVTSPPVTSPTTPSTTRRPASMFLSRTDSVRGGSENGSMALVHAHSSPIALARPDLEKLGRSSTSQLRTLSQFAQDGTAGELAIISPSQEVVGLRGRRRLQRADKSVTARQKNGGFGWETKWMDKQRQFLQAYEYLCHIGEAKEWIEDIIQRPIPPIIELEEALRDGVTLAEVVESLNPDKKFRIFRHPKLQYRHSDNIAIFFRYLDEVELPDLFRFELIDLYEKKNIPKVIYCLHALSWLLFRKGVVDFRIGNLVGQLEFEDHELEAMQKGLDKLGANMPSFGNMGADFGIEPAEPEETEEERIERELAENEEAIVELQAQARAALLRIQLGYTMQHLWDAEDWIIDLQSRIRGDFARTVVDYRLQMKNFAVQLQSAARGFLARHRHAQIQAQTSFAIKLQKVARGFFARHQYAQTCFTVQLQKAARGYLARRQRTQTEEQFKGNEDVVLKLQSMVRAAKIRNEIREQHSQLEMAAGPLRDIQATFRGFLARKQLAVQHEKTESEGATIAQLQSAVRGMILRKNLEEERASLESNTEAITNLQAAVRAMKARTEVGAQIQALEGFAPQWTAIQAAFRGKVARSDVDATKEELQKHSTELGLLQSHIRAAAVRREISEQLESIGETEEAIIDLQSMIRGMLERTRCSDDLDALTQQTPSIIDLQSYIRGCLYRKECGDLLDELAANTEEITELQALARAMLLRSDVAMVLDELEQNEESVAAFQAAAKAFVVRAKFEEKKRFFRENMQKVVKIQSFVRAKLQGEAYKSLTSGKNPPVNAVKNFVHLLNDSDFDFNEEVEFERLRKTVVQQVRQNEMLEQYIDQLDIKIALLVKNKITLDEVVRHQHNYGGHANNLLANSVISNANQFDLKALNKSSRKKLESYQQLFFTLQTQPQYLAKLFRRIREQGTSEKEAKRIEHLMMGLFGYAQKRREEYYLLKLIARSIREEVDGCAALQDYLRGNFFWTKLLQNYTRSPRDRKYLRDLLGPLIRDNIIEDPALDLESDPMQIYRSAINNEELRTGRPSQRPLDVPREVAIKDPETRELFIDHLRDLREICDQFLLALEDLLPRMPYGLRFVCRQTYEALCQHFQRDHPQNLLQLVSNWLWRFYLQPALVGPETYGVTEKQMSPLQKRNLGEVAKVLGQIASGRPFGGENIYLQPLNAFVAESIERLAHITNSLIDVPDAEKTFDIDEFNDLYAKNKPTLYIKMADIFSIHNLIASELPYLCPNRDDMLREIVQDLGSAKNNENEMTAGGSVDIQLFLTPKLHDMEDPEAETKGLFMETKRCILYIIRVQTGNNLLEILVKPITAEDEQKWRTVLHEDFGDNSGTRGAYSEANMIDVTRMSYYDLKRTALENILRLEQMGRISKQNYYQDILNAIALDIRTKSRRRVQRQRELEGVRQTLGNLHEKAKYLEQQRKSYDDYIEQAMATLQNKKGKKRFLLPFTKQYNHQRELERSGRVPKFGSFKYSARALSDKGVLVSWTGIPERDWGQINITISCDEVGIFSLEGSRGHIQMPGASALVPIEDLLQAQFEAHQFMNLFEGQLRLNVNLLLHLLYKKFYRTQ
ncbi:putative IQGAP protein [Sordaria brevicollis]|uniref:IQGAP protein n=1 Tax=Sordaria brevicollis TaxID=83679 RepID=A0AAE0UBW2_SORBR|nr:putative IQGAP protein [Sordaria brevicollis]